jgi:hypothetical protein
VCESWSSVSSILLSFCQVFPTPFRFFDLVFYCLFSFFDLVFYRPLFLCPFFFTLILSPHFFAYVVSSLTYSNFLRNKRFGCCCWRVWGCCYYAFIILAWSFVWLSVISLLVIYQLKDAVSLLTAVVHMGLCLNFYFIILAGGRICWWRNPLRLISFFYFWSFTT